LIHIDIYFLQYKNHVGKITSEQIRQYLQETEVHVTTTSRTAIGQLESSLLTIPEQIPENGIIACLAAKGIKSVPMFHLIYFFTKLIL